MRKEVSCQVMSSQHNFHNTLFHTHVDSMQTSNGVYIDLMWSGLEQVSDLLQVYCSSVLHGSRMLLLHVLF